MCDVHWKAHRGGGFGRSISGWPVVPVLFIVALWACNPGDSRPGEEQGDAAIFRADPYVLSTEAFSVQGDLGPFSSSVHLEEVSPNIYDLRIRIRSPQPAAPPEFHVRWDLPAVDLAGYWNTNLGLDRVNYYRNSVRTRATSGAPVLSLYNPAGLNRLTVAVSDALNPVGLASWVREEDARTYFEVTLCSERMPETESYEVTLRLDARNIPYFRALGDVTDWWAGMPGYEPAFVPDDARRPVYSTWYAFHQNLDVESVLAELGLAAELGYEVVIVDDGWQTLDSQRGYRYTGDWKPERIPDMEGFVAAVHELGMKFMLWYSVPLVGEESTNFNRFQGKYLRHWESQGAYVLDPRYPEVREFIIGTYLDALKAWDLDGFKLDFIGMFAATDSTVLTAEEGRDYASVNEATDRLMTDVMSRLREANPDILIEFRQPYIGPLMRKYGNMFRGVDAPNNAWANRAEVTDVRLLGGTTAPHSDMFMWHPQEPVEAAALQFLNVLFAVPQLSVRLTEYPDDHQEMVAFWTQYWNENRETLLTGRFLPSLPGNVYPVLMAQRYPEPGEMDRPPARGDGADLIAAVFSEAVVRLPEAELEAVDLVNAKATGSLVLESSGPFGPVEVVVYNAQGTLVDRFDTRIRAGIRQFIAPPSGLVQIRRR